MKKAIFIVLLFSNLHTIAQEKTFYNQINQENIILDIREKFTIINKEVDHSYIKKEHDIETASSEGSEIYSFYDQSKLRKISATYFGEMGKNKTDYYFWNDSIFFIFKQDFFTTAPFTILKTFQIWALKRTILTRLYFKKIVTIFTKTNSFAGSIRKKI